MLVLMVLLFVPVADFSDSVETANIIGKGLTFDVVVVTFDRLLIQALILIDYFWDYFRIIAPAEVSLWIFFLEDWSIKVKFIVKIW